VVKSSGGTLPFALAKGRCTVVAAAIPRDAVDVIASEMADGVERAVDGWMEEFELALDDTRLTTLGRLNAVREIVARYKQLTGRDTFTDRRSGRPARTCP